MRDLAAFIMRGPKQAAIVAFVSTLIPMMFWVGAAAIGLVTLRQGISQGFAVFIWAVIPALGWWFGMQDPGALFVLLITLAMAGVLRYTVSWQNTLVSGGVVSLLLGMVVPHLMPELIDTLMMLADEVFRELAKNAELEFDSEVQESFRSLMIASFAATFYAMATGAIFLARSWQSKLYNPGGWKEEFHQMRLSPLYAGVFFVLMFVAPRMELDVSLIFMIVTIPVVVCGLALVHGVIGKKKLGGQWLFGFYLSMILLFPTILLLVSMLALFDSVVNFRGRIKAS